MHKWVRSSDIEVSENSHALMQSPIIEIDYKRCLFPDRKLQQKSFLLEEG